MSILLSWCVLFCSTATWMAVGTQEKPVAVKSDADGVEKDARDDLAGSMTALSDGFRSLEASLASSDPGKFKGAAKQLASAAKVLVKATKANGGNSRRQRIAEELLGLALDAASGEVVDRARVVDRIRQSCVSCHATRSRMAKSKTFFPAKLNVITGKIRVRDSKGKARSSHGNVIVFLDQAPRGTKIPRPAIEPTISQKNRSFSPKVLPIQAGTRVWFPNDDNIFHNVFSLSNAKSFDLSSCKPGARPSVVFDRTGVVRIYCNIHPQMRSSIVVLANPWFCVTEDDGSFVIPEVPDGDWVLRTWNELRGESKEKVSLRGGERSVLRIDVKEKSRLLPHKNKFGKRYREKY